MECASSDGFGLEARALCFQPRHLRRQSLAAQPPPCRCLARRPKLPISSAEGESYGAQPRGHLADDTGMRSLFYAAPRSPRFQSPDHGLRCRQSGVTLTQRGKQRTLPLCPFRAPCTQFASHGFELGITVLESRR